MIKSFRIQNFKILRNLPIDPAPVNVLIGPNGCGKSSLLQAIDFLRAFLMTSTQEYLTQRGWNYRDLPNVRQSSRTIQWHVVADLNADSTGRGGGRYQYSVTLSPKRYLAIGRESLLYSTNSAQPVMLMKRVGRNISINDPSKNHVSQFFVPNLLASAMTASDVPRLREKYPQMRHFAEWIRRFAYFSPWDPKELRSPDRGKHFLLGPSGQHLAPVLASLKNRRPDEFQKLISRLRRVFPYLADISFSGRGWGWRSIRLHEKRGSKEVILNSQQVSDGLLRLLATSSFLYMENTPTVIMFEEPENGVHPHILREMVQVLKELALRKTPNKTQVFFTTHSPYVLDEFYDEVDQVWVMEVTGVHARSEIARLSERSQIDKAKESYGSLGEAWFSNVIGGTPSRSLFKT